MLKDSVREDLLEALVARGLTRLRKRRVGVDFGGGFFSWCGLNFKPNDNGFTAHVFVGVHCVQLERTWTSLKRVKYVTQYSMDLATVSIGIDRVVELRRGDLSISPDSYSGDIARVAEFISGHGLEYCKNIANYDSILLELGKRVHILAGVPEKYACCLYLMGKEAEAAAFIKEFSRGNANYLQDFTANFLKMCDVPCGASDALRP